MRRHDIDWWYWLATVTLLSVALSGYRAALAGAIALSALQLVHFALRGRGVTSFPVQVRASYLALLLMGLWPPLSFIHWVQLVGTWAMVLADYCFLARCLSLLPWNAPAPLTLKGAVRTFLSPPVKGNVLQGLPARAAAPTAETGLFRRDPGRG